MVLSGLPGMGPLGLKRLEDETGGQLSQLLDGKKLPAWLNEKTRASIEKWQDFIDLDVVEAKLKEIDARFVLKEEETFPENLKQLNDCPPGLYVKGNAHSLNCSIAIVGTRNPSAYGLKVAREMTKGLISAGYVVVSGLAQGIDAEVHRAALEVDGKTAAFLGNGFCRMYPKGHESLMESIAESAGVWTEFPLWRRADRQSFPQRNRLVAGATDGVIVVESGERGGSLITARFAEEQGRRVFVIPGRIDMPSSRGNHQLIRDGATLVSSVEEVLEDLNYLPGSLGSVVKSSAFSKERNLARLEGMSEMSRQIWDKLNEGVPLHADQISILTGFSFSAISGILVELEVKGLVSRRFDGSYEGS